MKGWENMTVTDVVLAIYVAGGTGKTAHADRPSHGLVLAEERGFKRYRFSDGTVLNAPPNALFYLPKGSSYQVQSVEMGGCYAINFQAEALPTTAPFAICLRDHAALEKCFREACRAWKEQRPEAALAARHCLYEAVLQGMREQSRGYLPSERSELLDPADDILQKRYTDATLQISELAAACGVSEVYFRRIFREKYGVSPHEHLARRRITYAAQLLESGQFTVEEAALQSGFSEPCHFSREFRRRIGIPPLQYKKTRGIS